MYKHKKRKAIFFTLFYPFTHKGVSYDFYVSEEVNELSKNFEEITILSLSTGHDGQLSVAQNVKVQNLNIRGGWRDRLALFYAMCGGFFRDEIRGLKKIYGISINKVIFMTICIYAARAVRYYSVLNQLISAVNFEEYDVWIYSYWNFEYALASVLLKDKVPRKDGGT